MLPLNKLYKVDPTNHLFFQHIDSTSHHINDLCEPLFEQSGLVYAGYNRAFRGGYMQILSNKPAMIRIIFNFGLDKYYVFPESTPIPVGDTQHVFWDDIVKTQPIISAVKESELDMGYGLSVVENHGDYLDSWHFATTKDNPLIAHFYKKNLRYLNHFIYYLKHKAYDLFDCSDPQRLGVCNAYIKAQAERTTYRQPIEKFIKSKAAKSYTLRHKGQEFSLSNRHIDCLLHLAHGKTAKEIGKISKISHRTVEDYIARMKLKLHCRTQTELVSIFIEDIVTRYHSLSPSYQIVSLKSESFS